MTVSVIIPVHNRVDLLACCLTSLVGQDAAGHEFEIVVCDDGSTEDLEPVIARFMAHDVPIRLIRQDQRGPGSARNLGIRHTTAELIVFVDSDVTFVAGALAALVGAMLAHSDWQGAEPRLIANGGEECPLWHGPHSIDGKRYHTASIAYRREALVCAGGFDETFKLAACEDVELALRILAAGPIGFVPDAEARHPRRLFSLRDHWHGRKHWRYVMILAVRYGILAFPGTSAGPFPRLRVALTACAALPAGRFITALGHIRRSPKAGMTGCLHACFDVICGMIALPAVLFSAVPARQAYL